jgi:hypothetical protein
MLWLYHRTEGIVHVEGSASTEIIGDAFVCRSSSGQVVATYPRLDVIAITDKPNLLPLWERLLLETSEDQGDSGPSLTSVRGTLPDTPRTKAVSRHQTPLRLTPRFI